MACALEGFVGVMAHRGAANLATALNCMGTMALYNWCSQSFYVLYR